ncbi:flavodoxin [Janibacter melonis]|uniref:Flavodoxin n=1 Tax=Janibacter melonis TaxID=262209 RepID=A0A176QGV8_9MICO|nr:flavodoxin [Janibacter melonis]OAB88943.1 flavodoxin [Janibacter melonis]
MATLLVVHHSPTSSMRALLDAALSGAGDDMIEGVDVVVRDALEATAQDVLDADGYVLGTTANFGYMSGALKHFFDSTFLAVGGALDADGQGATGSPRRAPFGLYVHGRYDTTGAVRSVHGIVRALGWTQASADVEVLGEVDGDARARVRELGATIAALLG